MSTEDFGEIFLTLARQLRCDADDDTIRSYAEALHEFPIHVLRDSALSLAREPDRKFFPTTGEWRAAALTVTKDSRVRADAGPHTWTIDCTACDDTGWERFECTGDTFCGRTKPHAAHTFVKICPCRATNRTYRRHHA